VGSKLVVPPVSHVAPGGTRTLSTVRPVVSPVRSSMRLGSMPFSLVRYCLTLRVRSAAASGDDEYGIGFAVQREGDVIETALGFVIHAHGAIAVALEGDAAEAACDGRWGNGRRRRRGDRDGGCGGGGFALVVDYVAGDVEGAWGDVGCGQRGCGAGAGDLAGGGAKGVGELAVLGASARGGDGDEAAGRDAGGGRRAGDGGSIVGDHAEGCGALRVLIGRAAFADASVDGVVACGESVGGDGGAGACSRELAAGGGPSVGGQEIFLLFEVQHAAGHRDGVAGTDAHGLKLASVGGWFAGSHFAEAKDEACGEPVGSDLARAAGERAGRGLRAIVDVGELVVGLDGADGEAIVQRGGGWHVVDACAAGDGPSPGAVGGTAVEIRWIHLRCAADYVDEGNKTSKLMPVDRAGLHGGEAVVGAVEGPGVFRLEAEGVAEVAGDAADEAVGDGRVLLAVDLAVDGMEIGVAAEDVDLRGVGKAGASGRGLGCAE